MSWTRKPKPVVGGKDRPAQPTQNSVKSDTPASVRLRVEEHLGVTYVFVVGALQVCPRQVVEVVSRLQHGNSLVVAGEERGQVIETVGGT